MIGYIIDAVAVFDVISVKKITSKVTMKITSSKFNPFNPDNCKPIHSDKPELTNPAAMARPPPNNSNIPQGNFTAVSQSSKRSFLKRMDGMINNTIAKKIAITPSDTPGKYLVMKNERVIHDKAAKRNTIKTIISSGEALPIFTFSS